MSFLTIVYDNYPNWLITLFIISVIIAVGLFGWNNYIEWKYKSILLTSPCQVCVKLNPEVGDCWKMRDELIKSQEYVRINETLLKEMISSPSQS